MLLIVYYISFQKQRKCDMKYLQKPIIWRNQSSLRLKEKEDKRGRTMKDSFFIKRLGANREIMNRI